MNRKYRFFKKAISVLLCLLLALGTAVPAFAFCHVFIDVSLAEQAEVGKLGIIICIKSIRQVCAVVGWEDEVHAIVLILNDGELPVVLQVVHEINPETNVFNLAEIEGNAVVSVAFVRRLCLGTKNS